MQRRSLLLLTAGAMTACASAPPRMAPELLLRLPPGALGRRLALAQQLHVWAAAREFQFEALLEADEQTLRLALLAHGRPMARLTWDGTTLTQQAAPGWPAAVSAERVLSDLILVLWPADAVAAALPAEWALEHGAAGRELRWRSTLVQRVHWDQVEPGKRVLLEHLLQGYRMQIDSRALPY